jgi:hypothetical protein
MPRSLFESGFLVLLLPPFCTTRVAPVPLRWVDTR